MNWALIGTGGISNSFATALHNTEGAMLKAVLSRSTDYAMRFAHQHEVEKTYTDYEALLNDPTIDIIYIGTPHTTHKEFAIPALKAKKAVLCEKPISINAQEAKEMINVAREEHVFLMEAMWTRFVPPIVKVREWLSAGRIGELKMVQANFGFRAAWEPSSRLLNKHLGGGALLDAGVYPISLASMVFGSHQPEKIVSSLYRGETGVDEECACILSYGGPRLANLATALRTRLTNDSWIYGTQGHIFVPNFVFARNAHLVIEKTSYEDFKGDFIGNGYNYEAESVMCCLREGKIENEIMPLDESLIIMQIMDTIRIQNNFYYPKEINGQC
ncbi:MAG: Gfo/Idh/MocA family oxidoreductase [Treponema sp.]|jgi:predicted dehydrogenase|nr:Gfo/Idh/MocA family oxidoreductase [Treponema sp.]